METAGGGGVRHILAVEDEPDHLLAVQLIFQGVPGYLLHGAANTAEADAILERVPVDVILLDLALPGEDGITFARRIKQQEKWRGIPIIAFSAYPHQIYRERCLDVGCVDFLDKPFHPRELVELVRKHAPL